MMPPTLFFLKTALAIGGHDTLKAFKQESDMKNVIDGW